MRKVLLLASLFIGIAACARTDTSTADTVNVKPAPAVMDTVPDSTKAQYDTTAQLNEDINGYDARNHAELRHVDPHIYTLRAADSRALSVHHEVGDESAEVNKRMGRQSGSNAEADHSTRDLSGSYASIQLLRNRAHWNGDTYRSKRT